MGLFNDFARYIYRRLMWFPNLIYWIFVIVIALTIYKILKWFIMGIVHRIQDAWTGYHHFRKLRKNKKKHDIYGEF